MNEQLSTAQKLALALQEEKEEKQAAAEQLQRRVSELVQERDLERAQAAKARQSLAESRKLTTSFRQSFKASSAEVAILESRISKLNRDLENVRE